MSSEVPSDQTIPETAQTLPAGNLALAGILGVVAAGAGATVWAFVTILTSYQIGWMAVGVGFLVGYAVSVAKGTTATFRILGAALAFAGCLAGNYLTLILTLSKYMNIDFAQVFSQVSFSEQLSALGESFQLIDLLFYAIAIYEGWKISVKSPVGE